MSSAALPARPRTILHLDSGEEMRGGQWQVIRLLRGLRKRGHQNMLLARANGPLLDLARKERFTCAPISALGVRAQAKRVDVVHAHDARSHTMAAFASSRPLVVSRRVVFPVQRNPLSTWKYSRAALYLAVSHAVEKQLLAAHIPGNRIRVVYDGVPLLPNKWDAKGPVVIPRFNDNRKGNAMPLDAASWARVPILRSTRLETDLAGASMLVYLTESEGLGSAALLAMSAAVPVVASDTGGLREVVRHGTTGMLVPNDTEAVARAIRQLRDDPETAREMSRKAQQLVLDLFSEDRMVEETFAAYESVALSRQS